MLVINKKFTFISVVIAVGLTILFGFLSVYRFDITDSNRQSIEQQIKQQTNLDLSLVFSGRIKVLPTPVLIVNEISLNDDREMLIRADQAKIKLGIADVIRVISGDGLDLGGLQIDISDGEVDLGILAEYIRKNCLSPESMAIMANLQLSNMTLISSQSNGYWNGWNLINSSINIGQKEAILTGNLQHHNMTADFNLQLEKNNQGFYINKFGYSGAGFKLTFGDDPANVNKESQNNLINNGTLKLEVSDFVKTVSHINQVIDSKDHSFDMGEYFSSTGNYFAVTSKIRTEDGRKSFDDFRVQSDQGESNIPGAISIIHLGDDTMMDMKLEIDEINIQHMLQSQSHEGPNILYDSIIKAIKYFNPSMEKNFKFLADIAIKKIKTLNGEIANLEIVAVGAEGVYILDHLSFSNGAGTVAQLNGVVKNDIVPKFQGSLELTNSSSDVMMQDLGLYSTLKEGQNTIINNNQGLNGSRVIDKSNTTPSSFKLNFMLAPAHLNIKNINAIFDNGATINGECGIMIDRDNMTKTNGELAFGGMNLEKIAASSLLYNYILKLYIADNNQNDDLYFRLTDDHSWLRYLNSRWNMKINLTNSSLNKIKLDDASVAFRIEPGNLNIINLKINSPILKANLNGEMKLNNLKPHFHLGGKVERIDLPLLLQIIPNEAELKQSIESDPNLKEIYGSNSEAFTKELNLFSANNYNMNINLTLSSVTYRDSININNMELEGILYEGVIGISKLRGQLADSSNFDIKSRFVISTPTPQYTVVMSMGNFSLKNLLYPIADFSDLSGYVSVSGILYSSGTNASRIKQKLNGSIKFIGKQFIYNGLDIDGAIAAVDANNLSGIQKLQAINKSLTSGQTYIDDIRGSISIKNGILTSSNTQFSNNRMSGSYGANYNVWSNDINSATAFYFKPINNQNNTLKVGINSLGRLPKNYKSDYNLDDIVSYVKRTSPDDTIPQSVINNRSVRDRASSYQ